MPRHSIELECQDLTPSSAILVWQFQFLKMWDSYNISNKLAVQGGEIKLHCRGPFAVETDLILNSDVTSVKLTLYNFFLS